jgi:hypothetical protein
VLLCTGLSNGSVVLYVAGADFDGTDGGGKMRIGVATGPSLEALSLHPEYLIEGTPNTRDERSVFPNGALLLSNGTVAMTYMGQSQVRLGLRCPSLKFLMANDRLPRQAQDGRMESAFIRTVMCVCTLYRTTAGAGSSSLPQTAQSVAPGGSTAW